jgi:hypothetical protein
MRNDLAASYCLANDIDLGSIANFVPVGNVDAPFTGSFFGNNRTIRNLTINDTTRLHLGLFGRVVSSGTIRDLQLVNVNVRGRAGTAGPVRIGGLAGESHLTITNVSVSGNVSCTGPGSNPCLVGGLVGAMNPAEGCALTRSWSSAHVTNRNLFIGQSTGGLAGATGCPISDSFATGNVTCSATACSVGGLAGLSPAVTRSFATGAVTGGSFVGGLVGLTGGPINQSFASGQVSAGDFAFVGGLVGNLADTSVDQSLSIGPVRGGAGGRSGGLIGLLGNGTIVTNSYWDVNTSGTAISEGGTGLTTAQLRGRLPAGFNTSAWALTRTLSYPFINDGGSAFVPQLATLVRQNSVYAFLPISQLDLSQYRIKPLHADEAALATVDTMIARAIGLTENVAELKNVRIDRFFWDDRRRTTTFAGPVTAHAALGALRPIGAAAQLKPAIDALNMQRLVILRGSFTNARGVQATHWMLATLYTRNGPSVGVIAANDPWTGQQVAIDPLSKKVVSPSDFPLANFKVNGFQIVVLK